MGNTREGDESFSPQGLAVLCYVTPSLADSAKPVMGRGVTLGAMPDLTMPCCGTKSLERRSAWGPSTARRGVWTIASSKTKSSRDACESVVTRPWWDIGKSVWVREGRRVDELCERAAHLGTCSMSGIAGDPGNLASKGAL